MLAQNGLDTRFSDRMLWAATAGTTRVVAGLGGMAERLTEAIGQRESSMKQL